MRSCSEAQADEILAILNEAIANSTALYDYKPRTPTDMAAWLATKRRGGFPVIGAFDEAGSLLGFGSFGSFRGWPAYKYTVEHSIYVRSDQRGRGLGRDLLNAIVEAARAGDYHVLIGGIDSTNTASIRLHAALGFTQCASIKQAGFKFGRWLDLDFYQLVLPTPREPVDG